LLFAPMKVTLPSISTSITSSSFHTFKSSNSSLRSFLLHLPTPSIYSPVLPTTNNSCTHDTQRCATVTEVKAMCL
jgi:hypothetical protein